MDPRDAAANAAMQALLPLHLMSKMQVKMNVRTEGGEDEDDVTSKGETVMQATDEPDYAAVASEAYMMADAMMRVREMDFSSQLNAVLKAASEK